MAKATSEISKIVSGSFNGEIVAWDLVARKSYYKIDSFEGQVKDVSCQKDFGFILAAGDNNMVKLYNHKNSKNSIKREATIIPEREFYTSDNLNSVSLN